MGISRENNSATTNNNNNNNNNDKETLIHDDNNIIAKEEEEDNVAVAAAKTDTSLLLQMKKGGCNKQLSSTEEQVEVVLSSSSSLLLEEEFYWDDSIRQLISQFQSILNLAVTAQQQQQQQQESSPSPSPSLSSLRNNDETTTTTEVASASSSSSTLLQKEASSHHSLYWDTNMNSTNTTRGSSSSSSSSSKKMEMVRLKGRDASLLKEFVFPFVLVRLELIQLLQMAQSQFQNMTSFHFKEYANVTLMKVKHHHHHHRTIELAPLISHIYTTTTQQLQQHDHDQITNVNPDEECCSSSSNTNTVLSTIPKSLYTQFLQDLISHTYLELQTSTDKINDMFHPFTSMELFYTMKDRHNKKKRHHNHNHHPYSPLKTTTPSTNNNDNNNNNNDTKNNQKQQQHPNYLKMIQLFYQHVLIHYGNLEQYLSSSSQIMLHHHHSKQQQQQQQQQQQNNHSNQITTTTTTTTNTTPTGTPTTLRRSGRSRTPRSLQQKDSDFVWTNYKPSSRRKNPKLLLFDSHTTNNNNNDSHCSKSTTNQSNHHLPTDNNNNNNNNSNNTTSTQSTTTTLDTTMMKDTTTTTTTIHTDSNLLNQQQQHYDTKNKSKKKRMNGPNNNTTQQQMTITTTTTHKTDATTIITPNPTDSFSNTIIDASTQTMIIVPSTTINEEKNDKITDTTTTTTTIVQTDLPKPNNVDYNMILSTTDILTCNENDTANKKHHETTSSQPQQQELITIKNDDDKSHIIKNDPITCDDATTTQETVTTTITNTIIHQDQKISIVVKQQQEHALSQQNDNSTTTQDHNSNNNYNEGDHHHTQQQQQQQQNKLSPNIKIQSNHDNDNDNNKSIVKNKKPSKNETQKIISIDPSVSTSDTVCNNNNNNNNNNCKSIGRRPNSSNTTTIQKKKKSEVKNLLKDNHRTNPKKFQLFASDFDNLNINIHEKGRPKRMIKTVIRYNARPSTPPPKNKSWKCGTGFHCPQCQEHLSYDVHQCWSCHAHCRYIPGTGPVLLRDRSELIAKSSSSSPLPIRNNTETTTPKLLSKPTTKADSPVVVNTKNKNKSKCKIDKDTTSTRVNGGEKRKITDKFSDDRIQAENKYKKTFNNPLRKKQKFNSSSITSNGSDAVASKNSNESVISLKKEQIENHYHPRECEVCFEFFPGTYIDAHRRKVHSLTSKEFGCPYCPPNKKLASIENRLKHIQSQHPGMPWENPEEERAKVKCIIYNCSECDVSLNGYDYIGLKQHMKSVHHMELSRKLNIIKFSCAFCIPNSHTNSSKPMMYVTLDDLFDHVTEQHKGCRLVGKRVKSNRPNNKSPKFQKETTLPKVCVPVVKSEVLVTENEVAPDETLQLDQPVYNLLSLESIFNKSWPYNRTIFYDGISFGTLMDKLERKLEALNKSVVVKKSREGTFIFHEKRGQEEEEYHSELLSLIKSIRERNNFADRERIEKLNYKQESEENLRVHNYNNRGRKPTHAEKEQENLLLRRIRIIKQRQRQKTEKCFITDDVCYLCNGEFARFIVTDEEIKKANGILLDALPLKIDRVNDDQNILNPRFRELSPSLDEISDDESLSDQDSNGKQNLRSNDIKNEFLKINELINSLNFAQRYNEGLLNTSKW